MALASAALSVPRAVGGAVVTAVAMDDVALELLSSFVAGTAAVRAVAADVAVAGCNAADVAVGAAAGNAAVAPADIDLPVAALLADLAPGAATELPVHFPVDSAKKTAAVLGSRVDAPSLHLRQLQCHFS